MARLVRRRERDDFHETMPATAARGYRTEPTVLAPDRASQLVNVITIALVSLLGLRLLLRLLGASTVSSFVSFIYTISYPFVAPFFGIFNTTIDDSVAGFELGTLFAMLVYSLAGYLIMRAIRAARGRD
jgi:hypothetical protein